MTDSEYLVSKALCYDRHRILASSVVHAILIEMRYDTKAEGNVFVLDKRKR